MRKTETGGHGVMFILTRFRWAVQRHNLQKNWILLSMIFIVAFFFRNIGSNLYAMGIDESYVASLALAIYRGEQFPIWIRSQALNAAYMVYLVAGGFSIFGVNDFAAHLPGVLVSSTESVAVYFVARGIWKNDLAALSASVIHATSAWDMIYSKAYLGISSISLLFVLLAFAFFVTSPLGHASERLSVRLIMTGMCIGIAAANWMLSLVMVIPILLCLLPKGRSLKTRVLRLALFGIGVMLTFGSTLALGYAAGVNLVGGGHYWDPPWNAPSTLQAIPFVGFTIFYPPDAQLFVPRLETNLSVMWSATSFLSPLSLSLSIMGFFLILMMRRREENIVVAWALTLMLLIPFIRQPLGLLLPRYMMFFIPLQSILAARCVLELSLQRERP